MEPGCTHFSLEPVSGGSSCERRAATDLEGADTTCGQRGASNHSCRTCCVRHRHRALRGEVGRGPVVPTSRTPRQAVCCRHHVETQRARDRQDSWRGAPGRSNDWRSWAGARAEARYVHTLARKRRIGSVGHWLAASGALGPRCRHSCPGAARSGPLASARHRTRAHRSAARLPRPPLWRDQAPGRAGFSPPPREVERDYFSSRHPAFTQASSAARVRVP